MGRPGLHPALRKEGHGSHGHEKKVIGKTVTCIGCGPSLTQEDVEKAYEKSEVIAINDSWRLLPDRGEKAHLYAADPHWWHYHIDYITEAYEGRCWSQNWGWKNVFPPLPGIEQLELERRKGGLNTRPGHINGGDPGSGGFQTINLALHRIREAIGDGWGRVLLLGYDMRHHSGKAHWFGNHPRHYPAGHRMRGVKPQNDNSTQMANEPPTRYVSTFRSIKPEDYKLEIINVTPGSAVDAFPSMALEDAL